MTTRISFVLSLLVPLATACLDSGAEDELEVDDAAEGDDSKADSPGGTYTYYFVQRDQRDCAAPACGGYFYRLANATSTKCRDGSRAERCYAAGSDWTKLGLSATSTAEVKLAAGIEELLVRATIGTKNVGGAAYAQVNPTEAWMGQLANDPGGPLVKISPSGIRCAVAPCPTYVERKLNSDLEAKLAELRWPDMGASEQEMAAVLDQMNGPGLIVSGARFSVSGPHKGRRVSQFWLRQVDEAPQAPQKTCYRAGCSGQVCSDNPSVRTTCGWREEYACYGSATCEVQADGECGWTQTPALQACLANN